ncbi:hypothetical protein GCM10020218_103470 [Dactylosporangium vinaceum]
MGRRAGRWGTRFTDLVQQHNHSARPGFEAGLLPIGFVQGGCWWLGLEYAPFLIWDATTLLTRVDARTPIDPQPAAVARAELRRVRVGAFCGRCRLRGGGLQETAERHAADDGPASCPHPQAWAQRPAAAGPARLTGATINRPSPVSDLAALR